MLRELLKDKRLILASKSPRRRALMEEAGMKFTIAEGYDVEEIYPADTPAEMVPLFLARLKSEAYPYPLGEGEILVTADTVVVLDGQIIGKPHDRTDAIEILQRLSGKEHVVVSGVMIRDNAHSISFSVDTKVRFRELRPEEIEYYIDNYQPYDKAGAYGIQEWIGYVGVVSVEGSFYNVMGLPIQTLYTQLEKFIKKQ
jgi:septum formation protein